MGKLVIFLVLALCVLHHDLWWWEDAEPLLFGFMPVGLAWHTGISIAAGFVWFLAVRFCWPQELVDLDDAENTADAAAR